MNRPLRPILVGLLVFLLAATHGWAQSTAQINGTVADSSGAALPGATVVAIQTDTGFRREVVTDTTGSYTLTNLTIGPYRLEVTLAGFRTYVQTGVILQVNSNPVIPVTLQLGSLEETVTVVAAAPLVETRNPAIGQVIDNEQVEALPLEGRNAVQLVTMAGAAVDTGTPSSRSMTTSRGIAITGGQPFGVAYLLDGAMHNNVYDNFNLPLPFPDALQEFRVETSSQNAQSGLHGGGTVSVVTKSGTNLLHGDVFEFARHHRFNATSPFAGIDRATGKRLSDGLVRNQFGGTLGGPIVRDRLFFFGAYQGTRATQTPADIVTFVPTAAMLAGDFTQVASAACVARGNITLASPFVGNRIDPVAVQPGGGARRATVAVDVRSVRPHHVFASDQAARGTDDRQDRLADHAEPFAVRTVPGVDDVLGPVVHEHRQHPGDHARRSRQRRPFPGRWRHDGAERHDGQQHPVDRQPHQRAPDARRVLRSRGRRRQHLQLQAGLHADPT